MKTHKPDYTMKTIATEEGSWKERFQRFLQHSLNILATEDPLGNDSSNVVIDALRSGVLTANTAAFPVDIQELYYSIPHGELFVAVREAIEG